MLPHERPPPPFLVSSGLTGGKPKRASVVTRALQGELQVWTEAGTGKGSRTHLHLCLHLPLPLPPLLPLLPLPCNPPPPLSLSLLQVSTRM